jgi:glucose-1-phosphate cytidylyltransferase
MKIYSFYGIHDFIICCGYKGYVIKEYFANYFLHMSDVTFHMADGRMEVHRQQAEPWTVTLVDTGEATNTGGRLKRVEEHLDNQTFCFTYGDGLASVDISALLQFHTSQGVQATVTAVQPPGRYGSLNLDKTIQRIHGFREKPQGDGGWINGGFFVLEPSVLSLIASDSSSWESDCLQALASAGELAAFRHQGFWQPMDTLRERNVLEDLWQQHKAPWKLWT